MEGTTLPKTLEGSEHIPQIIRIIDATVLSAIAIIGVVGNTLVFVAYTLSYKIRTKTNIFVVNLAAADFLTCLFLPFVSWSLLIEVERVDHWLDLLCGFAMGVIQVFAACSMVTIFSIAVNRYVLITRSRHTYNKLYRIKVITLWILFSWIYPILVITVPLIFNIGQLGFDIKIHACGTKTDHKLSHYYDLILIITLAPFPATVTACYGGIYLYVRKHNKRILETYGLTRKIDGCHSSSELNERSNTQSAENINRGIVAKQQLDITKNLFCIMVTYTICLTPQIVSELTDAQPFIILHTKILVAFNSCLNPIIYGVNHPHFREVFKCIVFCRWKDIPKPVFKWMNNRRSRESVKESHSKVRSNVSLKFISQFKSQDDVVIKASSGHSGKV